MGSVTQLGAAMKLQLEKEHQERMKAQERFAIQAYLLAKQMEISLIDMTLQVQLTQQAQDVKSRVTTFASNIEGGFSGQTANNVDAKIKGMSAPTLTSPVKAGGS